MNIEQVQAREKLSARLKPGKSTFALGILSTTFDVPKQAKKKKQKAG